MHAIERELIKMTGYKAPRKFSDREDYLKSLLNAVMKLTDDDFDNLTDEAAAWTNQAVDAHNSKNGTIPDFDEVEEATDDAEETVDEEATEDADEVVDDDEATVTDEPEDDSNEDTDPDGEDEPPAKPVKKKPAGKAKAPAKVPAKEKVAAKKPKPIDDEEDVVVDKWGCMEGSKNARALALFEQGATAKEVKDKIGGTYYNILAKMVKNGHKMEKDGAVIKITHSSEKGKKKGK